MATSYKVLGQSSPLSGNNTTLYTVPTSTEAIVSTITVANRGTVGTSYRIAVRPDGASIALQHYIAYDVTLDKNSTQALTFGLTMNAGDILTVYASSSEVSFNAFGTEITA
jgi:glucose-6-phosphate dehydrogenase assembly protein OpcA